MISKDQARELLRQAIGAPNGDFRSGQWTAIAALVNDKKKLLVIQRTGWGKSAVYFIATRILRDHGVGPTIIISPLLALMRNQIQAAARLGIRAATINSSNNAEWDEIKASVLGGQVDVLLISPERLANDEFVEEVLEPISDNIGLLVVDEAHCISDWGHDFRPDYRRILNIIRALPPNLPVLGTTATANERVVEDIQSQLGDIEIQRGPLMRESLNLQAIKLHDQAERLAWLAEHIPEQEKSGIIYVSTQRDAELVARWLKARGIDAAAYHGAASSEAHNDSGAYREVLEEQLSNNELKAVVATSALGMGYDKPDLGFVIHYQAPGSVVGYYQQVGRAGRAIDDANGILMCGKEDEDIQAFFRRTAFPSEENVELILRALDASDGLSVRELEGEVNLRQSDIRDVLKLLRVESPAPVVKQGSKWIRTAAAFALDQDRIDHLTSQKEREWGELLDYIDTNECRMQFLARALDDHGTPLCGRCDNCRGAPIIPETFQRETLLEAKRFLRHSEFSLEPRKQGAANGFPEYDFRTNLPVDMRAEVGRVLSRWGDAGWGASVREQKHAGHLQDELVEACVEMILDRWQPKPALTWVTCVPSWNNPDLVPSFAERLAESLNLPFLPAVSKIRDNEPQKFQQNRYHRCRNLDGVFDIDDELPEGAVLLVDDVVDSGWTLTVIAALLRREGMNAVFPMALASATTRD